MAKLNEDLIISNDELEAKKVELIKKTVFKKYDFYFNKIIQRSYLIEITTVILFLIGYHLFKHFDIK